MALFSKKNLKSNLYGLTEADLKYEIAGFPMGVVVRMLEEQELQGNEPNVKVFQQSRMSNKRAGGFDWRETEMGNDFWFEVITKDNWYLFYKQYPKYWNLIN